MNTRSGAGSTRRRLVWVGVLAVGLGILTACEAAEQREPRSEQPAATEGTPATAQLREEVEEFLGEALPILAEAYASGDPEVLRPVATERVVAQVEKRIGDLRGEGMEVRPRFEALTIEEISTFGAGNAVATTVETWDLRYHSTGSDALVEELPDSRSRVTYHLRKERDEGWRIYQRDLRQQFDRR